jgi:hypothetical protein
MPYDGERASALGHVPAMHERAAFSQIMGRWRQDMSNIAATAAVPLLRDSAALPTRPPVNLVIAVDGSEAIVQDGYVYEGIYQFGSVVMDLDEYKAAAGGIGAPVDRRRYNASIHKQQLHLLLPCGGFTPSAHNGDEWELWRAEVFAQLRDLVLPITPSKSLSLLDCFMLSHNGPGSAASSVTIAKCPVCHEQDIEVPANPVTCSCGTTLYPTDFLRTVEDFEPGERGGAAFGRIGAVAERLLTILYIEYMLANHKERMGTTLLVTDGPLAFFGPTAPMKTAFLSYWRQLSLLAKSEGFDMPALIGVEKTGAWVNFAKSLEMSPGQYLMPDNRFIARHIKRGAKGARLGARSYGADDYYGRHVIYAPRSGGRIVFTVMRTSGAPYTEIDNTDESDPQNYESLGQVLRAIDELTFVANRDAFVPVMEAHKAVSIPTRKINLLHEMVRQAHGGQPSKVEALASRSSVQYRGQR